MDFKIYLTEEEVPNGPFKKFTDIGADIFREPFLPYTRAAGTVGVAMAVDFSWDTISGFENHRLALRKFF